MAAIPPRTNIDGIKKAAMDGIDGAFERGKKYGRYLALQEYLQQKEESKPKWISVEERLPEDNVSVLVYIASKKENVDSVIAITSHTHSMHGYNISGWYSPWQYCFWDREVTHWMPLPEPPKYDGHD